MRMGINLMTSFSSLCKNCGSWVELHSPSKLKNCNDILKSKGGNLDKWT